MAIRNGDGEITDGCGIDLRILIVRYAELDELVRQVRAQKKAADAALRRYRGALRNARYARSAAARLSEGSLSRMMERQPEIFWRQPVLSTTRWTGPDVVARDFVDGNASPLLRRDRV
ncbi:helix-turn-helix domain-containing protein, partial [Sinorhizobium meliloti]|uniref:helix-turn-helix domain-containing protein n=1 Tax=Rhizobium meliloti TaxID=382 RepID=UPI0039891F52